MHDEPDDSRPPSIEELLAHLEQQVLGHQSVFAGYERPTDVTSKLVAHLTLCLATRPEERLGQLLVNALRCWAYDIDQETLWNLTDEMWIEILTSYGLRTPR